MNIVPKLAEKALEIAITQIGVQEHPKGSNWGKPVEDYLASVRINFPASWCMAFVYWCFNEAANQLKAKNFLVQTGGVLYAWEHSNSHHVETPISGDIMIIDFGKGVGHTGIVERVEGSIIHTIEGNTNDTGSREGYEVIRKTRELKKIKGFLRY
jgi:hypothetical protein